MLTSNLIVDRDKFLPVAQLSFLTTYYHLKQNLLNATWLFLQPTIKIEKPLNKTLKCGTHSHPVSISNADKMTFDVNLHKLLLKSREYEFIYNLVSQGNKGKCLIKFLV